MRTAGFDSRGSGEAVTVARDVASSSPSKNTTSALDATRCQTISPDRLPLANGSGSSSSSRKLPPLLPKPCTDAPADTSRLASMFAATSLEQPKPRNRALQPAPAPTPAALAIRGPAREHGYQPSNLVGRIVQNVGGGIAAADGSVRLPNWGQKKVRCDTSPLLPTPAPAPARETPAQARRRDTSPLLPTPAPETPAEARRRTSLKIKQRAAIAAASAAASTHVPAEKLMPPPSARGGANHRAILLAPPPRAAAVAAAEALKGRAVVPQKQRSAEEARAGADGEQQPAAVARGEKQPQQQQNRPQRQASEKEKGKAPAIPESPKQRQAPSEKEKGKAPAIPESPRRQPQQQQPAHELQKLMAAAQPELPRISTQLTRKEKEEDWLLMTGTKLPVRPKKRTKPVEKNVSMICPGQYMSDISRTRYMVREKKSRKEKRKGGLKAMDSDSD